MSEKYDLIFATSTPLTVVVPGILAKLLRRKPFVFEVRDLWPELPKALGMKNPFLLAAMSLLEWLGYRTADGLVGLSPGIVDGIKKRAPQKTPVTMIPNGCDLDLFDPKQRSQLKIEGIGDGDFVAGFTGAHGIANGLEAILAAAAVLKKRGIAHIKFLFVGDGNQKDKIVEQAKAQGLDNCIFLPPVPKTELVKITSSLDCGLMVLKNIPAFYYGTSPNKFFDYIASGIPVLNNYPGWLAEMITENNCGVVVTPDDAEEFATKLEELAGDRQVARVMGQNAHHLAEKNFSREKLSREFCEFLEHNLA